EQRLELLEQVRFRSEVTELVIAARQRFSHLLFHAGAVVAVEAVAFDESRRNALAPEDLLEGAHHRGRAGAGRSGHGDDRVSGGHDSLLQGRLVALMPPGRGTGSGSRTTGRRTR